MRALRQVVELNELQKRPERQRALAPVDFSAVVASLLVVTPLTSIVMHRDNRQSHQFVPKFQRRGVRLSLSESRLVRRLTSLVVKPNLVRPFWPCPPKFKRRVRTAVVEPCRLVSAVPVCALPNLAHKTAINGALPANGFRRGQPVRGPCLCLRRVFKYPAKPPHALKRRSKAAAIVAGSVVFSAPPLVIDRRKRAPQLARWVRNDRPRPAVFAGVALFRPSVNFRIVPVSAVHLHKQRGYLWRVQDILPLRAIRSPCLLRFPA